MSPCSIMKTLCPLSMVLVHTLESLSQSSGHVVVRVVFSGMLLQVSVKVAAVRGLLSKGFC